MLFIRRVWPGLRLAAFLGTTIGDPSLEGGDCNPGRPCPIKAVVDIDGTLSFVHPDSKEGDDSRSTSAATWWFGYPKKDNLPLWTEASPLSHVGEYTPPILFLNSAVEGMHAGREDFIRVLNEHRIYSEVHTFQGAPHSFCLFDPWFEPTIKYIADFLGKTLGSTSAATQNKNAPPVYKYVFTVAKDGSGDYTYIQDAINAMRVFPTAPITLYIKNGVYNEKIELPSSKTDVSFIGESVDKTIITFNDYSGRGKLTTFETFTAKIAGNRFRAENITFINSAGPVGQAVALHVESDRLRPFFSIVPSA